MLIGVARWYIFKPKIPIWENFGGSCIRRCWYIFWPFCLFYDRLVCCTKKNLSTLYIMLIGFNGSNLNTCINVGACQKSSLLEKSSSSKVVSQGTLFCHFEHFPKTPFLLLKHKPISRIDLLRPHPHPLSAAPQL
jgi:hypothetical protein